MKTKKQPSGRRPGRPRFGEKKMKRYNVILGEGHVEQGIRIGEGNLSRGLRRAVDGTKTNKYCYR